MQAHYHQQLIEQQQQLKCPRCESTNTKFCYYNNYNLSQPRHFCKDCRRYWTRGGTLRKVPVGGGTRKATTKRSASSSTSSPPPPTATVPSTHKVAKNEASNPAVSRPDLVAGHDSQLRNYNGSLSSLFLGSYDGTTDSVLHEFKGGNINDKNSGNDVDDELNGLQMSGSLLELQGSSGCWTSSDGNGGSWPHHHAIFSTTPGSNFQ